MGLKRRLSQSLNHTGSVFGKTALIWLRPQTQNCTENDYFIVLFLQKEKKPNASWGEKWEKYVDDLYFLYGIAFFGTCGKIYCPLHSLVI